MIYPKISIFFSVDPGIWEDYISKGGHRSYELYRRIFASENIGFGEPPQHECDTCLKIKEHRASIDESNHEPSECTMCKTAVEHNRKKDKAREKYQEDSQKDNAFSADMQTIILIPKLTNKEHVFVSRLVCFNETFSSMKKGNKDFVILWQEAL